MGKTGNPRTIHDDIHRTLTLAGIVAMVLVIVGTILLLRERWWGEARVKKKNFLMDDDKRFRRLGYFLMMRDEYATKYGTSRRSLTHHALTMLEIREGNPFVKRRIRRLLQKASERR